MSDQLAKNPFPQNKPDHAYKKHNPALLANLQNQQPTNQQWNAAQSANQAPRNTIWRRKFIWIMSTIALWLSWVFGIKELSKWERKEIASTKAIDVDWFNQFQNQTPQLDKLDRKNLLIIPLKNLKRPLREYHKKGLTSVFWFRKQFQKHHAWWDLRAPVGTPCLVGDAWTVVFSGWQTYKVDVPILWNIDISDWATDLLHRYGVDVSKWYGQYIVVSHGNDVYTLYAHLDTRLVEVGDTVSQWMQIATTWWTGKGAPHLHFEIREGWNTRGHAVSPKKYFMIAEKNS